MELWRDELEKRSSGVQTKTASEPKRPPSRLGKGRLGGVDVRLSSLYLTLALEPLHRTIRLPGEEWLPTRGPPHKRERGWLQAPQQEGHPCWAAHFY